MIGPWPAHAAGMKMQNVSAACTMQSDALARERRPLVGTAREGGRREGPSVRGGSVLGRNPGVQRYPDGCVVHAFRCASRSGAGPHREDWPEVGVPLPVCCAGQ